MSTGTTVNRSIFCIIGFFFSVFFAGATGQIPTLGDIPDQIIDEGQIFTAIHLDDYVSDNDNTVDQITWSISGPSDLSVNIDNSRIAVITAPDTDWNGAETITFTATDPDLNSNSDDATFRVRPVNDPPLVSGIQDQLLSEGSILEPVHLDNYVTDIDNAKDQLVWSSSGSTDLTVSIDPATHFATIATPNEDWNGSEDITFTATDTSSDSGSDLANYTLTPVNDPPVIGNIPDQSILEGQLFNPIPLDNFVTDVDNTSGELVWDITGDTDLVASIDPTRVATITFPPSWSGTENLTFTVKDPSNANASDAAAFKLEAMASAPTDINLSSSTIIENQPVSTLVGTLSSVDGDAGDSFTYSLVPGAGDTDNGSFSISGDNLVTNATFDFETKSSYTVRIMSTDASSLTFEKAFAITIVNSNEAPTDISLSASAIPENQSSNTVVGTLSSSDPDAGDSFVYSLVSGTGSTDNASFNISGNNLRTSSSFNYESKSSYSIRIRTTDALGLNVEKAFVITVTDVNEAPTDISLSNSTIAEGLPIGSLVGTFSSTDPDAGNTFTYTLVSGTGSTDNGSFTISGGQLLSNAIFDYETKSSYSIRVRTNDGSLGFSKIFTITIVFSNQAPTDISLSSTSIAENQPVNTVVGLLSTTDPNSGDSFTYSLVAGAGSTDNSSFNISGNQLRSSAVFDMETKSSYSVRIRTSDGSLTFEKAFTITVTFSNQSPTDISLSINTISENLAANSIVGLLSTTDPNAGDTYTYTLVAGTGSTDNGSFNINSNQLRINSPFDFETKSSYSIRVRSTDAGSAYFEKAFTITVINVNEAPTDILLSVSSIAENQPVNTVVGTLSSVDPDAGDTFTYLLVSGSGSTDNASFNLLGNQLRSSAIFDYELKASYSIRVRSTDAASAVFDKILTVNVSNVNEPPVIASANYTVDGRIGILHTGSYTGYSDPEGDAPGVHLYQWYISVNSNGIPATPINGATTLTYRPVSTDGGKYLCFEITPVDVLGIVGIPVKSVFRRVNDTPVASNAVVYAPNTVPGQTIRGRFTYADAESNPRGNGLYQWYRKNTNSVTPATPGTPIGNDSTYLLKNADAGKYIWFKVKPVATSGSTPGDSIWSNIIGPIGTFSGNISGTAGYCNGSVMPITLSITGGVAPYTAILTRSASSSNKDTTITGIGVSPYTINVKISGNYVLTSLTDASLPSPDDATVTSDPVVLSLFAKPSGVLTGGQGICNDGTSTAPVSLNLAGTAPWTFKISRGANNDTTYTGISTDPYTIHGRVIGSSPTTYRLITIEDAHCNGDTIGSGTARVFYKTSPSAVLSGKDTICPSATGTLKVIFSGTSGPWNITYLRNGSNPTVLNNISNFSYDLVVPGIGVYTLSRVEDASCTGRVSGTGTVISHTLPTATISGSATICEHATGNLNVALTGTSPWKYSYQYNAETAVEVLNVSSSPNILQVKKAGTYKLTEVYDKLCKGNVSGSVVITVTPAPVVSISGLAPAYDVDYDQMVSISGTPAGGTFSGPGLFYSNPNWYFLPRYAPVGTHNIVYAYRESAGSCYGYDTVVVRVLEANAVIEFPEDRIKYCLNEQPFTITGANLANNTGSFTISGGLGITDHHDNTATIDPSVLAVNEYTITYTYFDGTTLAVTSKFEVGNPPVADFKWETECFNAGQPIKFINKSSSSFGIITGSNWRVYTNTGYDTASTSDIQYTFQEPGNKIVDLTVQTSYGCSNIIPKVFALRPTISMVGNSIYSENFETSPLSWQSFTDPAYTFNSWKIGDPSGDFTGIPAGTFCWYTNIPSSSSPHELSWVTSPCFDFTGIDRPMLKLDIWRLFNSNRDGANLQFTADSGKTWTLLGQIGDGINWYNNYNLLEIPGESSMGWSNIQDARWYEARHSLDLLKGKRNIQFRIAYGSDGTAHNNHGIAFDNFWIGDRNRVTLLEHFTNASDDQSKDADLELNNLVNSDSLNIIDLQYHTSFPGDDPFNEEEPYIPGARVLYYGLPDVPYTILNGGSRTTQRFDYNTRELNADSVLIESLRESKFRMNILSWIGNNVLNTQTQISPLENIPAKEFTVHVAVIERKITGVTGNNGETEFESVVKTLLPDAAGTTLYRAWTKDETKSIDDTWVLQNVYNQSELRVVAFIQDESTGEIYQAVMDTIGNPPTGNPEVLPSSGSDNNFIVFPNPATDRVFIRFDKSLTGNTRIELYNNLGSLVYSGSMVRGTDETEIPTRNCPDGFYIIRAITPDKVLGIRKLTITR
jgi:hypothetical protein